MAVISVNMTRRSMCRRLTGSGESTSLSTALPLSTAFPLSATFLESTSSSSLSWWTNSEDFFDFFARVLDFLGLGSALGWASKVGVLHCQVKWFWQRVDKEKVAVVIESNLA